MARYTTTLPAVMPPWFQTSTARGYMEAIGEVLDQELARMTEARNARYPLRAPADALPLLAWERRMERYQGEVEAYHRQRLARAHDIWRWAGTSTGVQKLAEAMGFTYSGVWTLRNEDPTRWAEVDVYVDGRDLVPGENPLLYRAFRAFMPAHAKLHGLYKGVLEIWQDDGVWEDDGVYWGGGQLIPEE